MDKIPQLNGVRIIFVLGSLEFGGSERQALLFARYLMKEQGADVQVLGLDNGPGRTSQLCDEYGICWRAVPFKWLGIRKRSKKVKELIKLARELRKEKPQIVLPYTWVPNVACGLTWKFSGAKLCIWNQRDEGRDLNKGVWHRSAVKLSPYFISNSTHGKKFLIENYGLNPDKVLVVSNGITLPNPLDDRKMWRSRLGVSNDCLLACMVANFHGFKDHPTLLKAWRKVTDCLKSSGKHAVLLLAGRDDGREKAVKALAFDLDLGKRVRFLGKVNDISGLLHSVDLYVHSSKAEGCPNAILEALAAGLAVVGTNIPGIPEAVGPNGEQFLTPSEDADSLANYIIELLKNKNLREKIGDSNKQRIADKFNPQQMCQKTSSFITKGLNARKSFKRLF